jgi:hypothetical protein
LVASATIISGSVKTLSPYVFSPQAKRRRKIVQKFPSGWLRLDYFWIRPGSPIVLASPQHRHPPPWTWLEIGLSRMIAASRTEIFPNRDRCLLLLRFRMYISTFYYILFSSIFVCNFFLFIYALLCLLIPVPFSRTDYDLNIRSK